MRNSFLLPENTLLMLLITSFVFSATATTLSNAGESNTEKNLLELSEKELEQNAEKKPNLVVILVDDLGWADLGSYGSVFHETPNLDKMSQEGMRFTNAYAACAVCSPTRAALQTGLNPARVGVTDWIRGKFQGGVIPPDGKNPQGYVEDDKRMLFCPKNKLFLETEFLTIAEHLKANGYKTCHIGKWHLGQDEHTPQLQGYDINIAGCDLGQPPSYFDPYESGRPLYEIPKDVLSPREKGEYLTDREADEAVKFIRQNKNEPFFLHLAHYAVHTPLQAKMPLVEKYKHKLAHMKSEEIKTDQTNAVYAAMVESVDDAVGRILDTLVEEGLAENTFVIFTSDNGGLLGPTCNAPLRSGKGYPYEGGIREPFIVWAPGRVKSGTESEMPVITYDIFPTLCDWAGVGLPDLPLDGLSISPVTNPNNDSEKNRAELEELTERPLVWHFPHYRDDTLPVTPYSVIRVSNWKLIRYYENEEPELYNLENDPAETTNLAGVEKEVASRLQRQLDEQLDQLGALRVKPNPAFQK
ncbi:MAG: sulfatase [Thermoguttaceae bacterium]